MTDVSTPQGGDFLDRLIARHAPAPGSLPRAARVRPRLPGPFERVEAVRARGTEEDAAPVWPATTSPAEPRGDGPARPVPAAGPARLLTERERTVVRAEPAPAKPPPPAPPVPAPPLPRPVAPPPPARRPAPDPGRRPAGRPAERTATPAAASAPRPPGAAPAAPAAAPHPRAADTAAARGAVRQAAARRAGRAPEQVVRVQIGRLEVTAGPPPGGGPARRAPARRPAATVSLADYLGRGRE
ncbi:hypothetical protein [Streptomyces glaucescens]|uniref:Uncharacterized protein n=1 Tax=Streptomyces glaucescens TaxID=1907 RepID=A0A089X8Q5_STRGA|nr:hypothetical protein [Streptomyces glaucescens]AIR97479.1 hypothetical protein SGLAU_07320 [Streptomyces glaucescens]